jgi:hypothetical protein
LKVAAVEFLFSNQHFRVSKQSDEKFLDFDNAILYGAKILT